MSTGKSGRVLPRSADVAVRLALGVLGLVAISGVFFLLEGASGLSPAVRVASTIPLAGRSSSLSVRSPNSRTSTRLVKRCGSLGGDGGQSCFPMSKVPL